MNIPLCPVNSGCEEENMGFTFLKKLPTPAEIRNQYPIDAAIQELKAKRDQEIRDVFTGKSDKFLAIIGPCSADNEDTSSKSVTLLYG